MCPQRQGKCGHNQTIEFPDEGNSTNVTITNLTEGESCTYRIKAKCGAPAFKEADDSEVDNTTLLQVSFFEFNTDTYPETEESTNKTNVHHRGKMAPGKGLPPRDQSFENTGNNGRFNGQEFPKRKTKDGKWTDQGKIHGHGHDQEEDIDMADTTAVVGYGEPTAGDYDLEVGGYKTFGTLGQGHDNKGLKNHNKHKCANREMFVSVVAIADQPANETLILDLSSNSFIVASAALFLK
jgi:hypothetical protein